MLAALLMLSGVEVVNHKPVEIDFAKAKKATVVTFVSANCPCSASHEIKLRELSKKYSNKGFQFVAVHSNIDEDDALTSTHFQSSQFDFPVIQDIDSKYANQLSALKTPHTFVIDPKGDILYQGGVDDSHKADEAKKYYLQNALASIDNGQIPEVKETRSLGCVIKRK